MRITKVKVGKEDVVMQRDEGEGFLTLGEEDKRQDEIDQIFKAKKISFLDSVLNKTLAKKPAFDKPTGTKEEIKTIRDYQNGLTQQVRNIFEYLLYKNEVREDITEKITKIKKEFNANSIKELDEEQFKKFFGHKFQEQVEFKHLGQVVTVSLHQELFKALKKCKGVKKPFEELDIIASGLHKYQRWSEWYIRNKKKYLKKSIVNNKIDYQGDTSPRKEILHLWSTELVNNNSIDLADLTNEFKLQELVAEWQKIYNLEEKQTQDDVTKREQLLKEEKKSNKKSYLRPLSSENNGIPNELFEFKRKLKGCLQQHQRDIVDTLKADKKLSQFSLEVTKYLELYFPLKKSGKRLFATDISYYLEFSTIEARVKSQIQNAVMQYIIQQGKARYYQLEAKVNSKNLQQIKSQEAFALQFIDACGFAGNNLRNCIDPEMTNDILGKKDLVAAYDKLVTNAAKLSQSKYTLARFFTTFTINPDTFAIQSNHQELTAYFQQPNNEYKNFLAAVRGAISQIRNEIFHFKPDALKNILTITEFESLNENVPNISYQSSDLETFFKQEIDNLPYLWCEKLKSAGLFDFYDLADLEQHFTIFELSSKPLAFIPGFKTIFKWGIKYSEDEQYPLQLGDTFFRKTNDNDQSLIDPAKQARYNAMMLVYEQQFISYFTHEANREVFRDTVNFILDANRQRAADKVDKKESKNKHAFAFSEIKAPEDNQSVQEYLSSIQSQLIQEENKKREDDPKFSEQDTGHFQKFLWQLFMKGFANYIQQNQFAFIAKPDKRIELNNQLAQQFLTKIRPPVDISAENNIAFWTLCKMLDGKHLNELHNQMSKWQQAEDQLQIQQPINQVIQACQQIIQLCLLSVDKVSGRWQDHYHEQQSYFTSLQPYLTGNVDRQHLLGIKSLFAQENGSPIVIAPVEIARKYATENIIKQILGKNHDSKLSQENINKWQQQQENPSANSSANLAKQRQELHHDWTKHKGKDLKIWLEKNQKEYQRICEKLEQYNWLDNKVHLIHIQRLHHLLMDILGRMTGFVAFFDRDFQFLDLGCAQYRQNDDLQLDAFINFREAIGQISAKGLNNRGEINVDKLENIYHRKHLKFLSNLFLTLPINEQTEVQMQMETKQEFYKTHFFEPSFKVFQKRNSIAHFNYLGKLECSILTYLADLRKLVGYDRKLKNAVAKSFIDLLAKHGIVIKFKPLHDNQHQFVIKEIESKQTEHLGGKVKIDQHSKEYINMVRALLELGEKP